MVVKPSVSPEIAREILDETPDMSLVIRKYYQAIIAGDLPKLYLEDLVDYRDNYSDDLPGSLIPVDSSDYSFLRFNASGIHPSYPKLKCRGNSISGISLGLERMVHEGIIDDPVILDLVKRFRGYNWSFQKGGKGEFWTTQEEIDFINETLDTIINYIKISFNL